MHAAAGGDVRAQQHAPFLSYHSIYNDGQYLAYFKRSFVRKNYSEPGGIDRSSAYMYSDLARRGDAYSTTNANPNPNSTGGQRDLPFSYWPNQHNFFGFAYGITDRYIRSLWDEMSLLSYDDGGWALLLSMFGDNVLCCLTISYD